MKSIILYVFTPLVTFVLGVGLDRLVSPRLAEPAPVPVLEQQREVVPAAMPVQALVAVPAKPKPTIILDYPNGLFGIHAGYFMLGSKPKEFADFEFLELGLSEYGPDFVSVYEGSGDRFKEFSASFAFVSERRLFLVTSKASESDYEYRFDGEIVSRDHRSLAGTKKVALRGTLTKTRDGRKIFERVVEFRLDYLGC